MLKPFS